MAVITINNAMGGQTGNFLDQYTWSGHTLTYTANGSGYWFGGGMEGWTSGAPDYVEIFFFMGSWYSYDPFTMAMCQFTSFFLPPDGLNGLVYDSAFPPETMTFLPAGPPAPPDPPTDLSATDGTFETYSQVTWLSGGGSPATGGYSVYRDDVLVQDGITDLLPADAQDLTTFTETDPNGHITVVGAGEVDVVGMTMEEDASLQKDHGAAFFGTAYVHWFTLNISNGEGVHCAWAVSNVLDNPVNWEANDDQALWLAVWAGSVTLHNAELGTWSQVTVGALVDRYCEIERTDELLTFRHWASASARETRQTPTGTCSVAVTSARTHRYLYAANAYNSSQAYTFDFTLKDLGFATPGTYYYNDWGASADEQNPSTYYATATGDGGESGPSNEDTGWKSGGGPGIITKTIKPAGGGDYTNLADWAAWAATVEATEHRAECYTGDLGPVTLSGPWTGTPLITIYAADGHQHDGTRDNTNCARIVNVGAGGILILNLLVTIRKIRFDIAPYEGEGGPYPALGVYASNSLDGEYVAPTVNGCLFDLLGDGCQGIGFALGDLQATFTGAAYNNIVYGNGYAGTVGFCASCISGWNDPVNETMNVTVLENAILDCETPYEFIERSHNGYVSHLNLWLMNDIGCRRTASVSHDFLWTVVGGPWHGTIIADHDCSSDGSADDKGGAGHLINQNPIALFVNWQSNVTLQVNSPARNAGRDLAAYFGFPNDALTDDAIHDVLWRPQGAAWDMGALELSEHILAFSGHVVTETELHANLSGAHIEFSGSVLTKTELHAILSGAHIEFSGSVLTKTELHANLTGQLRLGGHVLTDTALAARLLLKRDPMLSMVPGRANTRRISWGGDQSRSWVVMADGVALTTTTGDHVDLDKSQEVREYLEVYDEEPRNPVTPLDEVHLEWAQGEGEQPDHYDIRRQKDGGAWTVIASVNGLEWLDGPLVDGVYDYTVTAVDLDGNEAISASAEVTISSAPEPPTGLTVTFQEGG